MKDRAATTIAAAILCALLAAWAWPSHKDFALVVFVGVPIGFFLGVTLGRE